MSFHSVLFDTPVADVRVAAEPACFGDLNLDTVVEAVTNGRQDYDLAPLFHSPLHRVETVEYRQAVLRDLGDVAVRHVLQDFAASFKEMREQLMQAAKLHYPRQQQGWFLEAVGTYCAAVENLSAGLGALTLKSEGMQGLRRYLADHVAATAFAALVGEARTLQARLANTTYCLRIIANRIIVVPFDDDPDYSEQVSTVFAKFRQGVVRDYRVKFHTFVEMNHIEAGVLDLVAELNPEVFAELESFCKRHAGYLDAVIARFDREVQFYLAYHDFVERLEAVGLPFCFPEVSQESKDLCARQTFDLALADRLVQQRKDVVRNDFSLTDGERILVVSGPNQGGKTTFARTFGQLHYLGMLGLSVPGTQATLFLPDEIFTHFEHGENLAELTGKLQDDLQRIQEILRRASSDSVVIMNEIFNSTTLEDAKFLATKVLERISALDALCVCVTFIDELASFNDATVSMVSTVEINDPAKRTYRLERRPADGRAYAVAIAEKYGLTYKTLKKRLAS